MRPLRLEMTGIGPFLNDTVIDFERLPGQSLFLIHGATGRGKSFIFDAICYALYGETPSGREHNLKSDFADADTTPRILFAFELGGRFYRVERTLAYERPKKRGSGWTEEPESLQLDRLAAWPDGKPHTLGARKTDVNNHLRELIGLDLAQFQQVVLLPQGEFRRLLLADSREREELLEKLFDAVFYQRVQNQVEDRSRTERKANHDLMVKAMELLKQAAEQLPEDLQPTVAEDATAALLTAPLEKFRQRLAEAGETARTREQERDAAAQKRNAAKALLEQFKRLELHAAEKQKLLEQAEAMEHLRAELETAERAAKLAPLDQQCREAADALAKLQDDVKTAANEHQRAVGAADAAVEKHRAEAPRQQTQMQTCRRRIDQLSALHETIQQEAEAAAALKKREAEQQQAKAALTDAKKELEAIRSRQKEWRREIEETSEQATDQARVKHEIDCLKRLHKWLEEYRKQQTTLTKNKSAVAAAAVDARQALEAYHKLRDRREANLAAELAASLKADKPCPVCGSREHPNPAASAADAATPEMVADAEEMSKKRCETHETMKRQTAELASRLTAVQQSIADLQRDEDWCDTTRLDEQLRERKDALTAAVKQQQRLAKLRRQLQELENTVLPNAETASDAAADTERQAGETYISTQAARQAAQQQIHQGIPEELREELGQTPTADAIRTLEARLKKQLKHAETQHRALQDLAVQTDKAKERSAEKLDGLKKQQAEHEKKIQERKQTFAEALQKSAFDDDDEFRTAARSDDWLQAARETLDGYKTRTTETDAKLKEARENVGDQEPPDPEPLEKAAQEAEQAFQAATRQETTMKTQEQQLDRALQKLQTWEDEAAEIRTKLEVLGRLDRQLRGQDQPKISFKRFFLAQRLEEVLLQASRRMQVLSNGRFVLKRAVGGRTAAQQTGLDLLVNDAHTGTDRPVNTLSGGQLFLASLAMALGLADVVQARSGGIRLDTLFIDEGFGTLDEETLELAMKVLNELRRGRMVGVISHVTELRRQIVNRVEVEAADVGSKIRLHVEDN